MKAAIIIPPNDFRDETLSNIVSMLTKWGVSPSIASYTSAVCTGYHGAKCHPDIKADSINADEFDVLVLIDGPGFERYKLWEYRPLFEKIKNFAERKKLILGIGNTIEAIARSNIIKGVRIAFPENKKIGDAITLYSGILTRNRIESQNNIITATSAAETVEAVNKLLILLGAK